MMAPKRIIALFVIGAALACALLALEVGKPAPSFTLNDQFGKTTRLSDLKGSVVVIVAATRKSGDFMGPWVDNLKSKYSGNNTFRVFALIDLHSISKLFRGIAVSRIRKETKDPVLIDFDGKTAKAYEVSDNYPVVVVIDKDSVIKDVQKTKFDKKSFGAVTSAIDKALQGPPAP